MSAKKIERNIKPGDYLEPRCPLGEEAFGVTSEVKSVPQQRIVEKMDEYMSHRDYDGAERHLLYWLEEAMLGRDLRGELMIRNELVGHYRKVGNRDEALKQGDAALELLEKLDFLSTISAGTTYVNVATACNAFGENGRALELFRKARHIYESIESVSDRQPQLLGGLYNNMALTLVAMKRFKEADEYYEKALSIMGRVPNGGLEQAITYLNMANSVENQKGPEAAERDIETLLDRAYGLLTADDVKKDGYYAFVCEKCAPTFSYYGYFLAYDELMRRSKEIYERP